MALNFPSSPTVGPPATTYGRWQWNGIGWVPIVTVSEPMLPIAGGNVTGNLGVAGTTSLTGTLTAAGQTNLNTVYVNSTLDVLGQATFDDGVEIDGDEAATKPWVDQQIAAGSLWQGTWDAATNVPDLTNVNLQNNGFTWSVTLADPTAPYVIPATPAIPGLSGVTVYNGDHVIWSTAASAFEIVHGSSLSLAEAQDMFVDKTGDTMTGPLVLSADPAAAAPLGAATKQYVDNALPPVRIYNLSVANLAANSIDNVATIPGWTPASRDLIFLHGSLGAGTADAEYFLNINALGRYPVRFATTDPLLGRGDQPARGTWNATVNAPGYRYWSNFWGYPRNQRQTSPGLFILRFDGTVFQQRGLEQVYNDLARDYFGTLGSNGYQRMQGHRYFGGTGTYVLSAQPQDMVYIYLGGGPGSVATTTFKMPAQLTYSRWIVRDHCNDPWQLYNPAVYWRKRKLLVSGGTTAVIRLARVQRNYSVWDESNLYFHNRMVGYAVNVPQHFIDQGLCTTGTGYVDIAVGSTGYVEISYMFAPPVAGGSPRCPQTMPAWITGGYSYWNSLSGVLFIDDISRRRYV